MSSTDPTGLIHSSVRDKGRIQYIATLITSPQIVSQAHQLAIQLGYPKCPSFAITRRDYFIAQNPSTPASINPSTRLIAKKPSRHS